MLNKTEDTVKLMQSLIADLGDLIENMKKDYGNIINDQKKEIDLLVEENNLLAEQVKERGQ